MQPHNPPPSAKLPAFLAFKTRPGPGTRFLARKNVAALVNSTLTDILTWTLNPELRYTFLLQLYSVILCCEDAISPFADRIISLLYRYVVDEEKKVREVAQKISYALGFYVSPEVFVPIFLKDFQQKVEAGAETPSKQQARNAVVVFAEELKGALKEDLKKHLPEIVKVLSAHEVENDPLVVPDLLVMTHNLLETAKETSAEYRTPLFHAVLNLSGIVDSKPLKDFAYSVMELLAKNCALKGTKDLFSIELGAALKEYMSDYATWGKGTLRRYAFDSLVRNAKEAVGDHWDPIIEIIAKNVDNKKEYEVRFDMLQLLEDLIDSEEVQSNLQYHSEKIVQKVLIPCCVWKAGKPNIKIRKAAVTCMIKLIEKGLIEKPVLYKLLKDLMGVTKSCLDDDWAADLRFASCVLVKRILSYLTGVLQS